MQTNAIDNQTDIQEPDIAANAARIAGVTPRAFSTAKAGNAASDYEDAWAAGSDCLAIADGATESSFARLWAQALVEGFVSQPAALFPLQTERPESFRERLQTWTQPLQKAWHAAVPWTTLPWFAEDKARSGAFATLLAFQAKQAKEEKGRVKDESELPSVFRLPSSAFQAFAIGDSCLFQIRDGQVKIAFPLTHSSQFDSRPVLLSSNPVHNKRVWDEIAITEGTFEPGDILLFATDALARWFLAECEGGTLPWHTLCALRTQEEFEALAGRLRREHVMRNDDVTLVIVDASEAMPRVPQALTEPTDSGPEQREPSESAAPPQAVFAGTPSEPPATDREIDETNGLTSADAEGILPKREEVSGEANL